MEGWKGSPRKQKRRGLGGGGECSGFQLTQNLNDQTPCIEETNEEGSVLERLTNKSAKEREWKWILTANHQGDL